MAKQTVVNLIDDIDGSKAETSCAFTWDGIAYEIDLSKKNSGAFDKIMAPYVASARTVTARPARRAPKTVKPARRPRPTVDLASVRVWAAQNNHSVSARGRIAGDVLDAFHAATTAVSDGLSAAVDAVTPSSKPARRARPVKAAVQAPAATKSGRRKPVEAPAATTPTASAAKATLEAPTVS
jgi:hypothetical protein